MDYPQSKPNLFHFVYKKMKDQPYQQYSSHKIKSDCLWIAIIGILVGFSTYGIIYVLKATF